MNQRSIANEYPDKRFTDAELAAELWFRRLVRQVARQYSDVGGPSKLDNERLADLQLCHITMKKVTMSRELENVIRVEGQKFAPPSLPQAAVPTASSESVWLSDEAVESAVRCLKHFYPDNTQEIALSALQAASFLLTEPKGKAKTQIPEKAVEAAAEAMWVSSLNSEHWDQVDYRLRWVFREDALLVLEAVELNLRNSRK